ncbi:MAG: hypothetical protein ACOC5T_06630 [Elusimicrobiota bacterium]
MGKVVKNKGENKRIGRYLRGDTTKLSKKDADLFYKLNWGLLFYVNQKYNIIEGLKSPNFAKQSLKKVMKLHDTLFSHPELIDSFIQKNPFKFSKENLEIIKGWKNFIKDRFFVVKYTKDGVIFLKPDDEPKAYAVLGLYDEIRDILGEYLPIMIQTVLLPFKGKIVYCGLVSPYNIHFGSGIRRNIEADYQKAKSKYGIIKSLEEKYEKKRDANEEMLKYYVKSEGRREEYWYEVEKILEKNPSLWKIYYQEVGKSNARKMSKRLKQFDIKPAWFAVLDDLIIASAQTEKEAKEQVENLLLKEKQDYVHIFKYKGKRK